MRDDYPASGSGSILFWVSVLGLFVELMFIRWIGTEFRIFAYLQNTVLVTCFMGLGMGCLASKKPVSLKASLGALLAIVAILSLPPLRFIGSYISAFLSTHADQLMWDAGSTGLQPVVRLGLLSAGLVGTALLLYLIWAVFIPMGQILGRAMDAHPRTIRAYSINIAGSLVGILLFTAASVLHLPPVAWVATIVALFLALLWRTHLSRWQTYVYSLLLIAVTLPSGWEQDALSVTWSQYQKLVLWQDEERTLPGEYLITVNGAPYQQMHKLDPEYRRAHPRVFSPEMLGLSQYDIPIRLHPNPRSVLIVGAGSGNDVAGALLNGAERVTAVEIDPVIADLGRRYHPDSPYDNSRVELVIDDARAYFADSKERFDVIAFGLLDSHTTTTMANARLDHFVYTRESIAQAASLLADGGVMVLSFYPEKVYVIDRIARVLREQFGEEPIVFHIPGSNFGWGGVLFVSGDQEVIRQRLEQDERLAEAIAGWQRLVPEGVVTYQTPITTDDWPYLYLDRPHIPLLFFLIGGVLVFLFLWSRRQVQSTGFWRHWDRSSWHFFFMGAGFLLLETQNVSRAAVAFGSTWLVNAIIITAVLLMVLLANLVAALLPRLRRVPVLLCLVAVSALLYFVDIARFMHLPFWPRAAAIAGILSLPVFFSGIAFVRSFVIVPRKEVALGANMFGALAGGVLQSITFISGMRMLLLVVGLCYVLALFTLPRPERSTADA